jgi:hypothetical protein
MVFCYANIDPLHEITCGASSDPDLGAYVRHNISRSEAVGKKHFDDFPVLTHGVDSLSRRQNVLVELR